MAFPRALLSEACISRRCVVPAFLPESVMFCIVGGCASVMLIVLLYVFVVSFVWIVMV